LLYDNGYNGYIFLMDSIGTLKNEDMNQEDFFWDNKQVVRLVEEASCQACRRSKQVVKLVEEPGCQA
jgi:hypothetical protein